jgi:transcriptional regulator with XRE-family HTH domain
MKELINESNIETGRKLRNLRNILLLSYQDIETATKVSRITVARVEDGEKGCNRESVLALIFFYGYELHKFYDFSKRLPTEKELKKQMIDFHINHESKEYEIIYKQPDLIELIEQKLLKTALFNKWVEVTDVYKFCKEKYVYEYNSISGTLILATKKGLLTSRKKDNDAKARVNEYRKP